MASWLLSRSPGRNPVIDRSGLRRTRRAYRMTYATVTAVSTTHITNRSTMPSPSEMSAAEEATPVAKGFTVEQSTPIPAPRMIVPTATIRS